MSINIYVHTFYGCEVTYLRDVVAVIGGEVEYSGLRWVGTYLSRSIGRCVPSIHFNSNLAELIMSLILPSGTDVLSLHSCDIYIVAIVSHNARLVSRANIYRCQICR